MRQQQIQIQRRPRRREDAPTVTARDLRREDLGDQVTATLAAIDEATS